MINNDDLTIKIVLQSLLSQKTIPPTFSLRRSGTERKPVIDLIQVLASLTQVGKSTKCNKYLRRSSSPPKKTPMERPPAPTFTKVCKVLDDYALV